MEQKRILIVFPHNFFELKSGVHKRFYELVRHLKNEAFIIDLFGLENFESNWKETMVNYPDNLINELFLYDFSTGHNTALFKKGFFLKTLFRPVQKQKEDIPVEMFDFAYDGMKSMFHEIVAKTKYDFIVISYVYWANLLSVRIPYKTCAVLTMEDFITQNLFETFKGRIDVGQFINEEIRRVNLFDKVICLSNEELSFFSKFAPNPKYYYLPIFMKAPKKKAEKKIYDILFVGFDNSNNKKGLAWFFEKVHPLLSENLTFLIAGKISKFAPPLPNVTCIEYIEDIGEAYGKSKITINPLQDGTGMKVKVIESISYGIPVVNTPRGLCGMKPEIVNQFICAGTPSEFAHQIEKLISDDSYYETQCKMATSLFRANFEVSAITNVFDEVFTVIPYK